MDVLGLLQTAAAVLIVLGIVLVVLGLLPPTRVRFGDTAGWGVTLLVLGFVMLLILLFVPALAG